MLRTFQIGLTTCARRLSASENALVKGSIIKLVKGLYDIDMTTAPDDVTYTSFDQFFTRDFKEGARPIAQSEIVHPVDGKIVDFGTFDGKHPILIKHKPYSQDELFIADNSNYISYYLAPYNHHQIYMPADGKVVKTVYIPGMLYSVKPDGEKSKQVVNFKNERLVIFIETNSGPITLVLVGALLVGSISTAWDHRYYPNANQEIITKELSETFAKGESIARFHYGSSVILVTDKPLGEINCGADNTCFMGQAAWS